MEQNDIIKLFRKYISDKTMHYKHFKKTYICEFNKEPDSFDERFIDGYCHGLNAINKDLQKDLEEIESIINKKIGTGLRWCRQK